MVKGVSRPHSTDDEVDFGEVEVAHVQTILDVSLETRAMDNREHRESFVEAKFNERRGEVGRRKLEDRRCWKVIGKIFPLERGISRSNETSVR